MNAPRSLSSALGNAHDQYIARNPASAAAHQLATAHLPGGNTRTSIHAAPFPLTFARGLGPELTSLDDQTYIDFLGEYTAGLFGHSNPVIQAAIAAALAQGWNYGGPNTHERALAAALCDRFKPALQRLRFTNSGSEANTYAVAAALAWTGRRKILVFDNAYHGASLGFSSAAATMLLPHDWIVAPFNDIDNTRTELLNSLEPAEKLAAVLVEPMQGSAGAVPASTAFLTFLRDTATAHDALLIFDEVMTSRLARNGLGQSLGIQPDLLTLGKWVCGGMTAGVFGGRADIMELFNPDTPGGLRHAGTFNNNVVSMAAGVAALSIYDVEAVDELNRKGEALRAGVAAVFTRAGYQNPPLTAHPSPDELTKRVWISGRGSILAVRFAGTDADLLRPLFWQHLLEHGYYIAPRGFISLNMENTRAHVVGFESAVSGFAEAYLHTQAQP